MPALTIPTNNPPRSRSASPTGPPMSPITPPLRPTNPDSTSGTGEPSQQHQRQHQHRHQHQQPRQTYTHSQPDQTGMPPPAPEPIAFDTNPDVIALRSAISVLQVQRKRATEDIQTLSRAMGEAVDEPEAFVKDLVAGKKSQGQAAASAEDDAESDDDDDDDDHGEGDAEPPSSSQTPQQARSWTSLPQPQNVVRAPPINWAQYAVVGDSLDKLHAEQLAQPTQGQPAVVGPSGTYEFKGGGPASKDTYRGVAAPYAPGKDRIERQSPVQRGSSKK